MKIIGKIEKFAQSSQFSDSDSHANPTKKMFSKILLSFLFHLWKSEFYSPADVSRDGRLLHM